MTSKPNLADEPSVLVPMEPGPPHLLWVVDAQGHLQWLRPHPASPLATEAAMGTSYADWLPAGSHWRSVLEGALAGGAYSEILTAGGQWFLLQVVPLEEPAGDVRQVVVSASDVTAIKQAEENLRHVVTQAPEGVAIHDGQRLVYANEASLAILGFRDLAEATRVPLIDLVHPADRALVKSRLEAAFRTGQAQPWHEERLVRRDGRVAVVEIATLPTRFAGQPAVLLLSRDLTDRKRAEDRLQQSQRTLATLMSHLPGMVYRCELSPQWRMTFVSEGARELTGYRPDDLIDNRTVAFGDLIHPEDAPAVWETVVSATTEGRPFQVVYRIRRASGEVRWVQEQGRGILSEGTALPVLEGFITDITERKLAEQERDRLLVKAQEARAQAEAAQRRSAFLAEAGRQLVSLLDHEAALACVVRLGIPTLGDWCLVTLREAGGGVRLRAGAHADPASQERIHQLIGQAPPRSSTQGMLKVMETGEPVAYSDIPPVWEAPWEHSGDAEADRRFGEVVRSLGMRAYMVVPLTSRGQTFGVIAFGRATGRFDDADVALAMEFADRVAPTLDNARLYQEARRAVLVRDDFLSIASHELKTPLTALQLAVQAIVGAFRQGGLAELPPETLAFLLDRTDKQIKRLSSLVTVLLDVSRLQSGRLELELAPVDLVAVVREAVADFQPALAQSGSACRVEAPERAVGRWDRARLEQVVTNLLANAVKYGGGQPIELSILRDPAVTRLVVRDQGIGIPSAKLDKIFERFERAVSARHYGGLGLGLFIAKQIVTALGGSIDATSGPEQGATFIVTLPNDGPTTVPQQTGDRE